MPNYLHVSQEAGKNFYMNFHDKGKIVMLNLLKFRETADYTNLEDIRPAQEITGREAYQLYVDHTLPELEKAESRVVFYGDCNDFLIGPESEKWDAVLLVEHQSAARFIEFAQDGEYQKTVGHRTAALADSRLLPSTKK